MKSLSLSILLLSFLAISFVIIGCSKDDNPVDPGDTEHQDAVGVMLISGADTLVIAATANDSDVEGKIIVYVDSTTAVIETKFLDSEGHWFTPHHEEEDSLAEEDLSLKLVFVNSVLLEAHIDEWSFTLRGIAAGATSMNVQIIHEDHPDYHSPSIPIEVRTRP